MEQRLIQSSEIHAICEKRMDECAYVCVCVCVCVRSCVRVHACACRLNFDYFENLHLHLCI